MPAAPDTGRGFISRHWRSIGLAALVGFILGGLIASQTSRTFRSSAQVQITEPALLSPIDGAVASIDDELRLAGSIVVGTEVRRTLPRAEDVSVATIGDDGVIEITATAASADGARQLAQTWAEMFITVRRQQLMERYGALNTQLGTDLDEATETLGTARLADDAAGIAAAEEERDRLLEQRRIIDQVVQGTRADDGAIVVRDAERPSGRSGLGTIALFALGSSAGALLGAAAMGLRDRQTNVSSEDLIWTELSSTPVDEAIVAANEWPDDQAWAEAGFSVSSTAGQGPLRIVAPRALNGSHGPADPAEVTVPPDWADEISLIADS